MNFLAHIEIRKLRQTFFRCSIALVISYPLENLLENNATERGPVMLPDEIFEPGCAR
jgi:hypothetical protein